MNPFTAQSHKLRPRTTREWRGALALAVLLAALPAARPQGTNAPVTNGAVTKPATNGTASPNLVIPTTNSIAPPPAAPAPTRSQGIAESNFQLVSERNIFNASRSGGRVTAGSSRPAVVQSFTLVGTMAYTKGIFAFFQGSSSEFSKVVKLNGTIAGHKVVDVLDTGVKLEADGKVTELAVGASMRREDEGLWHPGDAAATSASYVSSRGGDGSERSGRNGRGDRNRSESRGASPTTSSPAASADQAEVLKRLMERREKD